MAKPHASVDSSVWTADGITISTKATDFFGIVTNQTAGSITLTDDDGIRIVFTPTAHIDFMMLPAPLGFNGSLVADNSGTGNYTVLYRERQTG